MTEAVSHKQRRLNEGDTHSEKHVCHVLLDSFVIGNDIHRFVNTSTLSGQDGLINTETA